ALARKAGSVGRREAVAGWLYTVAYHIALRARKAAAKRAKVNLDLAARESQQNPVADAIRRDLAAVLDEEVSRLPKQYRVLVVLCYLEGKTYQEAARLLNLPVGTLSARRTRARTLLRTRLIRRGIDLSGAILITTLCEQATSAAALAALVNGIVKAATSIAAGQTAVSATVAALTEGVLRSMFVSKLKIAAVMLLAGLLVTGMRLLIPASLMSPVASPAPPKAAAIPAADKAKPARVDRYGDPLPAGVLFRFGSVRMRHGPTIRASALSPDGKLLATTSGRSVVLWDLAAGKSVRRFLTDHHWCFTNPGITFSPDGRHLGYV